ncbi:MAG: hypothetical protein K0R39_81 [Symbiobacteriaceae bacterium]|nr:hypothetical protein [Symbiobacteriaceae bacterium]
MVARLFVKNLVIKQDIPTTPYKTLQAQIRPWEGWLVLFFNKLLGRLGRQQPGASVSPAAIPERQAPPNGDGWVELVDGRLVVHDPGGEGKFATLVPEGGARLWINGVETVGLAVVSADDELRCEVDPNEFFRLSIADDEMSVTLTLTADPGRTPDSVTVSGQQPCRLRPGYSAQAGRRQGLPRDLVLAELRRLGVQFGIDEAAIHQELQRPAYVPVVAARGQEALPPDPGQWVWKLDTPGLVEPGQMIAQHQGGSPGCARVTVKGEATQVFDPVCAADQYLPGAGTRLLAGGRLVATAQGRARVVPDPAGHLVRVFPVRLVEAELTGALTCADDLIVRGNIRNARVETTGEVWVAGSVERSEVIAAGIVVRGAVALSKLLTIPRASCAPLRGELSFLQRRVIELGDAGDVTPQVKEAWFKEAGAFVRAVWRKADELHVIDPSFKVAVSDVYSLLVMSNAAAAFSRTMAQPLALRLALLLDEAARAAAGGEVRVRSLAQTEVWAGRYVYVEESFVGSTIFAGGTVETGPAATCSQGEVMAGDSVKLGVLATLRGTAPVTVRCRHIEAAEAQAGSVFEFGADRKEIGSELFQVTCRVNQRGFLAIKQK